ncbi:hypothetical protein EDB84DRAFT_1654656 [Lactarius hengduanensis]|nr:hypothetical protein EDB84DRAFT_1654656 [Lactarius hengduanensis]
MSFGDSNTVSCCDSRRLIALPSHLQTHPRQIEQKDTCRTSLKVGGNKGALIARLEEHDAASGASLAPLSPGLVGKGACEVQESFESAACGEGRGEDNGNSTTTTVSSAKAWVDTYILQAQRKSGSQTEKSTRALTLEGEPCCPPASARLLNMRPDCLLPTTPTKTDRQRRPSPVDDAAMED